MVRSISWPPAARDEDGRYGTPEDGALYRSRDGAETWECITLPQGCNGPNDLAVDPRDPNPNYLAAWGRFSPPDDACGGIYRSTDGGATWESIFAVSQHAYAVTLDPEHPDTLYMCGFDAGAYRSTDGGESWERLKGYNFKWGHRVVPDPHHPGNDLHHHLRRVRLARTGDGRSQSGRGYCDPGTAGDGEIGEVTAQGKRVGRGLAPPAVASGHLLLSGIAVPVPPRASRVPRTGGESPPGCRLGPSVDSSEAAWSSQGQRRVPEASPNGGDAGQAPRYEAPGDMRQ